MWIITASEAFKQIYIRYIKCKANKFHTNRFGEPKWKESTHTRAHIPRTHAHMYMKYSTAFNKFLFSHWNGVFWYYLPIEFVRNACGNSRPIALVVVCAKDENWTIIFNI